MFSQHWPCWFVCLQEAVLCVKELESPNNIYYFVEMSLNHVLERSSQARRQTGQLLHDVVKQNVLSVDAYLKGWVLASVWWPYGYKCRKCSIWYWKKLYLYLAYQYYIIIFNKLIRSKQTYRQFKILASVEGKEKDDCYWLYCQVPYGTDGKCSVACHDDSFSPSYR